MRGEEERGMSRRGLKMRLKNKSLERIEDKVGEILVAEIRTDEVR